MGKRRNASKFKKIKLYNLNKDNFQKRQIIIEKRRKKIIKISTK